MTSSSPGPQQFPYGPVHTCWACGAGIDPLQAVGQGGVCDRFECRAEGLRRQLREETRIEEERREAAREALRRAGVEPDRTSWSLTPSNSARPVPLRPELRDAFLLHLRRILAEAEGAVDTPLNRTSALDLEDDEGRFPPPDDNERRALEAGCATCRGWCCRRGGTHAFLEPPRIRRLLEERPELGASDVVDLYAAHLGDSHLEGGCVFQAETGCALPRALRGDTCNRYHCSDLTEARRMFRRAKGHGEHHFVAIGRPDDSAPRIATADGSDVGIR